MNRFPMFRVKLDDNEGGGEFIYLDLHHYYKLCSQKLCQGAWEKEDFALKKDTAMS